MLITKLLEAGALKPTQREAVRILRIIIERLDVVPTPNGTVAFAFRGDVELLDRIAAWGADVEDDEAEADEEDGHDEPDDRSDPHGDPVELPSHDIGAEPRLSRGDLDQVAAVVATLSEIEPVSDDLAEIVQQLAA